MKIGILGGGQLGRMFMQNAMNYPYDVYFMDIEESPCSIFGNNFSVGDIKNFDNIVEFGRDKDIISIEIENVNIEGLRFLEKQGKQIIPSPNCLEVIKDKGIQKEFYKENKICSSKFYLIQSKKDLQLNEISVPFIQKLRVGGYDGKGVQHIKSEQDLTKVWDEPSVIEEVVEIKKELSVIVSVGKDGGYNIFDVVEMVFDDTLNLVDYIFSPADISNSMVEKVKRTALDAVLSFNSPGIFCVELFLLKNDKVFVNEIAPRVHNSGHHTIEANYSSQYDQMFRVLLGLPLGDVSSRGFSAMYNLIGAEGYNGKVFVEGLEEILNIRGIYFHFYGKEQTKPGRKMGHVTIVNEKEKVQEIIKILKEKIIIKSI